MENLRIRNSMIPDWETMCKKAFFYRWFGTDEEKQIFDISDNQAIRWGVYFETLVLGSGLDGKTIELTDKEKESVFYKRIKRQAEIARRFFFKDLGIPKFEFQHKIHTSFVIEGHEVPVEMNIDAIFGQPKPEIIYDTKFTGDTKNTFGKWAWGAPEKMDMGQGIMYSEGVKKFYNLDHVRFGYYVADSKEDENVEILEVIFQPYTIEEYMYRVYITYMEIRQALSWNYFPADPEYNKCRNCPAVNFCPSAITRPQVKIIEK